MNSKKKENKKRPEPVRGPVFDPERKLLEEPSNDPPQLPGRTAPVASEEQRANGFSEKLEELTGDLVYISETDADVVPFYGKKADKADRETLLEQIGADPDAPFEERDFGEFFEQLTRQRDWHDEEHEETARRFLRLQEFLEEKLRDLKVFRIGEIELEIYVVGLREDGVLAGVRTEAVET